MNDSNNPVVPGQADSTASAPSNPARNPEAHRSSEAHHSSEAPRSSEGPRTSEAHLQFSRSILRQQLEADVESCQRKAATILAEENNIERLAALALTTDNTRKIKVSIAADRARAAEVLGAIENMDEFAQTRDLDDLFDDDFTPIPEPVTEIQEPAYTQPQRPKPEPRAARVRGTPRSPAHGITQTPSQMITTSSTAANKGIATREQSANTETPTEIDPTASAAPQPSKPTAAVRGDRTATGGITKPKLTEDELSERLAAAKLNNAKRAEAHRLAEADEASFQQREAKASQKRKEEGAARRVMNMEREKNRLRKLGAQGNREWDEGKEQAQITQERGSQYRRGANGGVNGVVSSRGHQNENENGGQERGSQKRRGAGEAASIRGGRGRGGGRGGFVNAHKALVSSAPPQTLDPAKDFPALPTASSSKKSNWADEMEEKEPAAVS